MYTALCKGGDSPPGNFSRRGSIPFIIARCEMEYKTNVMRSLEKIDIVEYASHS